MNETENAGSEIEEEEWLAEMRRYYIEHGCYRAEDVHRLLGDQTKVIGPPELEAEALFGRAPANEEG